MSSGSMRTTKIITIRIPAELAVTIKAYCKASDLTVSQFMRAAVARDFREAGKPDPWKATS